MSNWTHIRGTIEVAPLGRTQPEKRYILETVLSHLPIVSGSERDMNVHIVQAAGHDESASSDEFGQFTDKNQGDYGERVGAYKGWFNLQSKYYLLLEADLRDRDAKETYGAFIKWLNRLAKRVPVYNVFVKLWDEWNEDGGIIIDDDRKFIDLFEAPSWSRKGKEGSVNWCEYMMWNYTRDEDGNIYDAKPDFPDGGCFALNREKRQ